MKDVKFALFKSVAVCLLMGVVVVSTAQAMDFNDEIERFVQETVAETQLPEASIRQWLDQAQYQQSIIDAMTRPAEGKPWHQYRPIFIKAKRIELGRAFLKQHAETLKRAEDKFGVPAEIITAIIGVETYYGGNTGSYKVLDALATLGFHYPKRGAFFRKQLKAYFVLSQKQQLPVAELKGSYAGAMGYGQFIPTSYRDFAIDFDGDERADILNSVDDAIGSVANYLSRHKWKAGEPIAALADLPVPKQASMNKGLKPDVTIAELEQQAWRWPHQQSANEKVKLIGLDQKKAKEWWIAHHNFYVITRYNHSALYAMAVFQLSQAIAE